MKKSLRWRLDYTLNGVARHVALTCLAASATGNEQGRAREVLLHLEARQIKRKGKYPDKCRLNLPLI
jgi:hypothetical protein